MHGGSLESQNKVNRQVLWPAKLSCPFLPGIRLFMPAEPGVRARSVNDQSHTPHRVRFGTFEVDLATGELWKSGRKLKLTGQPFSVLAILLERPGEVYRIT